MRLMNKQKTAFLFWAKPTAVNSEDRIDRYSARHLVFYLTETEVVYFKQFDRWDPNCANVYSFELRNTSRSIWSVRRRCTCCNCLYFLGFIFRMRSLLIRTLILNLKINPQTFTIHDLIVLLSQTIVLDRLKKVRFGKKLKYIPIWRLVRDKETWWTLTYWSLQPAHRDHSLISFHCQEQSGG